MTTTRADPSRPRASSSDYDRALLNILEDFAAEREQLWSAQRALFNLLEDYAGEKERLTLVQKAAMNILDDFGAEKARLVETQRAVLNVLEDFSTEKVELERTKRAALNILDDLALEKERLEESQRSVLRSERALRESLHEKEVLLREVHHRVKNNLQVIASLLSLQGRYLGDEASRAMLEESQGRIHSIALVHEALYQSGDVARICLGAYLRTLTQHLLDSWGGVSGRVTVQVDVSPLDVPIDAAMPCGLIVNELVTNAFKHAFPGDRAGVVRVSVQPLPPDRTVLAVADDGAGLPETVQLDRSGGLGLELVATLARQLRGTVRVARRAGTTVEVTLPGTLGDDRRAQDPPEIV